MRPLIRTVADRQELQSGWTTAVIDQLFVRAICGRCEQRKDSFDIDEPHVEAHAFEPLEPSNAKRRLRLTPHPHVLPFTRCAGGRIRSTVDAGVSATCEAVLRRRVEDATRVGARGDECRFHGAIRCQIGIRPLASFRHCEFTALFAVKPTCVVSIWTTCRVHGRIGGQYGVAEVPGAPSADGVSRIRRMMRRGARIRARRRPARHPETCETPNARVANTERRSRTRR